jgi:DNA-directed RNA polymerase specialized sigma24 family protein
MAALLEPLVDRVLAGDEGAWQLLWQATEPRLDALLRRPGFLGPLAKSEDHRKNIVVDVLGALRADGYARLRKYADARRENPRLPFFAWLTVVAKRMAIDYMRRQNEYVDRRREPGASSPGGWLRQETLPADSQLGGQRPPMTDRGTALELIGDAGLDDRERDALARWTAGDGWDDIATALALEGPRTAEKLVRAALERLRRKFRDDGGGR